MGNFTLEKFHLKNLDCASCAAKIERGLKNVNGISNATVDFANLTLYAKTDDIKRVIAAVQHTTRMPISTAPSNSRGTR